MEQKCRGQTQNILKIYLLYSPNYYGDKIKNGNEIDIAIWYMVEKKPTNFPVVSGCIAFKSFNKKYWRQNFHIPSKVLEESTLITEKDYNELTTRIE